MPVPKNIKKLAEFEITKKSCTEKVVRNFTIRAFLIKMTIFVDKSNEKGPKRCIDVKLLNKGQNNAEINPIFQRLSIMIFVRFKFLARFLRARSHDKIFLVIPNPAPRLSEVMDASNTKIIY